MKKSRMITCLLLAAGWLLLSAPRAAAETAVSDYIRLHVVAQSDSAWDQGVKLAVRDAVRAASAEMLKDCTTAEEAWQRLQDGLETLEEAAQGVLDEWNVSCGASVWAGVDAFPERVYGGLIVPAGEYRAVRVTLGEGAGKNWWCVLFPSLCLPAGADGTAPIVFYSSLGRWLSRLFGGNDA